MIVDTELLHSVKWLTRRTRRPTATVYSWLKTGRIPCINIDGTLIVNELDFPEWLRVMINNARVDDEV